MKEYTLNEQWEYLVQNGYVTEETLQVVTSINGYNQETIDNVIYTVTGYHDIEQLIECEG